MIKITYIIPYEDIQNEVYSLLNEVKEEGVVIETTHIIGTQEAFLRECDADIVVARGVTYLAIKRNLKKIAVIEIAVTGYDIIRAIEECKRNYNPVQIAVIGSESMVYGAESLEGIMGVELEIYKIENEYEATQALNSAKEHGCDAVVGGLMVYRMARSQGWQCVWIKTGKEAIRQSIIEALNAVNVTRLERAKAELFKIILENTKEAIIAVDQDGTINAFNKAAYRTLKIPQNSKVNGQNIRNMLSESKLLKLIETGEEETGIIDKVNDAMVVSSHVPIRVEGYKAGSVITFQNVDKIQEIESKIRKELSSKGLVAKYNFSNIVGKSSLLNKSIQTAYKYSQVDSNILLIGETGTGKELFAQSIHNASNRKNQPFVAVNCAAVPENLLESELFGYSEGAFSGASKGGKLGLFELAHKGTLFLDEVSELPLNLQAKLLRVLQEREIRRIGDDKVVPIDVRIITATNIDLKEKSMQGQFRQDLLYRLDVLNLKIPSLHERREDIENIVMHFIDKYCRKFDKPIPVLEIGAIETLNNYSWPGNIRELRNICERLVVLTEGENITAEGVSNLLGTANERIPEDKVSSDNTSIQAPIFAYDDIDSMLKLMQIMKVSKSEAARLLGISRTTLWRKMKEKS